MQAIYQIKNLATGDIYIGSAVDYESRKWSHKCGLRKNKHHSQILQNSWNKHGEKTFVFEVVEIVEDKEKLIEREQYYIDTLNPRYNISRIAGSPLGVKHTDEAKKNMSLAHLGKKLSKESIRKRTLKQTGIKRKPKTIQKLKEAASKRKIPISQYNMNGKFIKHWDSAQDVYLKLGFSPGHIRSCCRGIRNQSHNFKWKFKFKNI